MSNPLAPSLSCSSRHMLSASACRKGEPPTNMLESASALSNYTIVGQVEVVGQQMSTGFALRLLHIGLGLAKIPNKTGVQCPKPTYDCQHYAML